MTLAERLASLKAKLKAKINIIEKDYPFLKIGQKAEKRFHRKKNIENFRMDSFFSACRSPAPGDLPCAVSHPERARHQRGP